MPSAIHVIHVAPVFGVFVATWRQSRCQHSGPAGSGANSSLLRDEVPSESYPLVKVSERCYVDYMLPYH